MGASLACVAKEEQEEDKILGFRLEIYALA
jgi:hypothetical protein